MADLSQAPLRELAGPVDETRLQHNLQAVRQRQVQRRVRRARVGASLASLTACALLAWFGRTLWLPSLTQPGPLAVASGLSLERLRAIPIEPRAGAVTLDDGSRIHLNNQSRLELIENSGQRVRSVLHAGWARFEVTPGGPRRWIIDAGLAEVEVVGTAFSLQRSADETWVRVHHGRVLVRSALAAGKLTQLSAGQELRVRAVSKTQQAAPAAALSPLALGSEQVGTAPPASTPAALPTQPATAPDSPPAPEATPLSERARGSASASSVSPARSALMRADALRAAGDATRAAQVLTIELNARPTARETGLIALTLAQLQLDELKLPAQAAQNFAHASRAWGLPAALREQALARQVEAQLRAGEPAAARARAHDYAQRYPNGTWSGALRTWLETAAASSAR